MHRRRALVPLLLTVLFAGGAGCDACGGDPPITAIDAGAPRADAGALADAGAQGLGDAGAVTVDAGGPGDAGAVGDAGQSADGGGALDAGGPGDAGVVVDGGGSPPASSLRIVGGSGASSSTRFKARVRVGAPLPSASSTDGARTLSPSVPESP